MKMKIDILTIFPEIFDFYKNYSLLKKAREKGVLKLKAHNLRDFTEDKHKAVDDSPFGGGRGMVMKIEPIYKAVKSLKRKIQKLYYLPPGGKSLIKKWQLILPSKNTLF